MRTSAIFVVLAIASAAAAAERPNIILIMADDMGWSDLGCYGGEIETPHIDSLATDGLRFTRFYNNAVCGPTRASLLTGLYCQQVGHPGNHWNRPKDYSKCIDVMATCLDVAGVDYPTEFRGRRPLPMEGKSLAPIFRGEHRAGHEYLAWSNARGRAISTEEWKLVRLKDNQPWELYNIVHDIGETDNQASKFPDRVRLMAAKYETWRKRVGAR